MWNSVLGIPKCEAFQMPAGKEDLYLLTTEQALCQAISWMFSSAPPGTVLVQAFPPSLKAGPGDPGLGWTSDAQVAVLPAFREGCFFQIKGKVASQ